MSKATTTPKVEVVPTVDRKWFLEDGTEIRKVSNPEDYKVVYRVKKEDASTSYVNINDYVPTVRTSATEENLVAVAKEQGISEDMARLLFRQAKALKKK